MSSSNEQPKRRDRKLSKAIFEDLPRLAASCGASLTDAQLGRIGLFCTQLAEYNEHTNLVAKADPHTLVIEHVLDALTLVSIAGERLHKSGSGKSRLIDIGSGAGFPAMILAICLEDLKFSLVESTGKKVRFLESAVAALGLQTRVSVHNRRAEELAHESEFREKFELATARAVGNVSLIVELTFGFLSVGGVLLAQKSQAQIDEEMAAAARTLDLLGGREDLRHELNMETGKSLVIVEIEKTKATPPKYPRPSAQLKRAI